MAIGGVRPDLGPALPPACQGHRDAYGSAGYRACFRKKEVAAAMLPAESRLDWVTRACW
jgi:hypothetical protein